MKGINDFIFLHSKIGRDGQFAGEVKNMMIPGKKAMPNLGKV